MDNFTFIKDREVIFETEDKVFTGKLFFIDKNKTYITFKSVQNFNDNKLKSNQMTFYKPEIKSIRYLSSPASSTTTSNSQSCDIGNVNDVVNLKVLEDKLKCVTINTKNDDDESPMLNNKSFLYAEDISRIRHRIAHLKYISKIDGSYHDALRDIKNQYEIGMNIEGEQHIHGRSRIAIIAVTTLTNIYLFDVLWLGPVPELMEIFMNERIEKIIHNSRRFTKLIKITNIFDTMVAHAATDNVHRLLSIQECVADNFGLPECFVNVPKNIDFTARPVKENVRKIAAQNVAYLLLLQKYFTRKMMQPFYRAAEHFHSKPKTIQDLNELDAFELNVLNRKEITDLKDLQDVNKFNLKVTLNDTKKY